MKGWNVKVTLKQRRILLGVTGGIAAYKSCELIRLLRAAGAEVRVVMTSSAKAFVSPLSLQALSEHVVYEDLLDSRAEAAMGHIELARWAELVCIVPASADFMARLAHGLADDLLTTLCLATPAPIMVAAAMNQQMWRAPATVANQQILRERGIEIVGPADGKLACGDVGVGRLLEPVELQTAIVAMLQGSVLQSRHVVLTAGPTREAIDPVRFLSNRSSGKMAYALAAAAYAQGARVTVVSGPVQLAVPYGCELVQVGSALEMREQVMNVIAQADIFIAAAAVADYYCKQVAHQKITKEHDELHLSLHKTPDILAEVAMSPERPFCVGFSAQTENVVDRAREKLMDKRLDMIIANQVGEGLGFEVDDNEVTVIEAHQIQHFEKTSKRQLAQQLMIQIAKAYDEKNKIKNTR